MLQLSPDECRVLGVLVEKALTTPGQYPLSLNALTTGCNQKNNRNPVVEFDEERVYDAADKLKSKGLAREAFMTGTRVQKFRHVAREALAITIEELVVLTDLLLRGPQTMGELRGNASRMHPIASLDACQGAIDRLIGRSPEAGGPLVKELPPSPGSRAKLFVQLLCPDLHPIVAVSAPHAAEAPVQGGGSGLLARVEALEAKVAELERRLIASGAR
jgi:uncharacterized protein YceH (UPF0502 family)